MTAKYDLDELNRHFLFLERLASGGINSVVLPSLDATYDAVAAILNGTDGITSRAELNAITRAITEAVEGNAGWATLTKEDLQPLAVYESNWEASYVEKATELSAKLPAERTILGFINTALMTLESGERNDVGLWKDFVKSNVDARSKQINGIVQLGFTRGETVSQMKTKIKQLSTGLLRREAEALARTGYIHYAAQATEAMVQANKDILQEYYYIITFDNRLSSICRQIGVKFNDPKNRFKVGDPKAPMPPHHYNCRTRRLAVPKGFELTGTRAAIGGKKGADAAEAFAKKESRLRTKSKVTYSGKKDANIFTPGQVDASEGYEAWLRNQPRWFVEDSLGVGKAKLFLDNKLSLTKFSDMTAQPLTLAQIREREGL
jgi:SPP1 gp7 family putative phage head morphogenesis protein